MAAPTVTARQAPVGFPGRLENGFSTKIACASDPDISFWETEVTPPGLEGPELIDISTMHNILYVTMAPGALITLTESSGVAGYDPAVLTQILAIINDNVAWTLHHPDGSTWAFWGVLRQFTPQAHQRNVFPTVNFTITPTNYDPTNRVEAGPAVVSVAGT